MKQEIIAQVRATASDDYERSGYEQLAELKVLAVKLCEAVEDETMMYRIAIREKDPEAFIELWQKGKANGFRNSAGC